MTYPTLCCRPYLLILVALASLAWGCSCSSGEASIGGTGDGSVTDDGSVTNDGSVANDGSVTNDGGGPITCGNGVLDDGEACDDRNDASGDGCSSTCVIEAGWACPILAVACRAAACGDGVLAGFEECDDGNDMAGDGCSDTCALEQGYACDDAGQGCRAITCGDGVREGGEPCDDGNNDLGDGCTPLCTAEPVCNNGLCNAVCGDALKLPNEACDDGNTRDGDGCSSTCKIEMGFTCEPVTMANPNTLVLPLVLRDFKSSHPDMEGTTGTEKGIVETTLGQDGKPVYAKGDGSSSATTNGADAFQWWYRDHPNPSDAQGNYTILQSMTLTLGGNGFYTYDNSNFFPVDGLGFGNQGNPHNFHFTSEVRYWFEYDANATPPTLNFRGDDDVWVFINRKLAVDLGGVHGAQADSITLDAGTATNLGLSDGGIYEIVVFQAERHTTQSNYRLELGNFLAPKTTCESVCGDGILTRFEACDDGVNDGTYGSCTADCTANAPGCGDSIVQDDEGETCDDGVNDGTYNHCTTDCQLGRRCGDMIIHSDDGEECDDGNSDAGDGCTADCRNELM